MRHLRPLAIALVLSLLLFGIFWHGSYAEEPAKISGTVTNFRKQPIPAATITYSYEGVGEQVVKTDTEGKFEITSIPLTASLQLAVTAGGYDEWIRSVPVSNTQQIQIFPVLSSGSDQMAPILLIPALLGLLLWGALRVWWPRSARPYMLTIPIWVGVLIALSLQWLIWGAETVPFFQSSIAVPFYVPLAAFLGVMVYCTRSIVAHFEDLVDSLAYRKTLMAMAHRVLLAPYIAIFADLVLFRPIMGQITALQAGAGQTVLEFFLAFFTGMYVKQILGLLDQLGRRIMSEALRTKLKWQEEPSPLMAQLDMHPELASRLSEVKSPAVTSIGDLADLARLRDDKKEKIALQAQLDKRLLDQWIEMAKIYQRNLNNLDRLLIINDLLKAKLAAARISSLWQLGRMTVDEIAQTPDIDRSEAEELMNTFKDFQISKALAQELEKQLEKKEEEKVLGKVPEVEDEITEHKDELDEVLEKSLKEAIKRASDVELQDLVRPKTPEGAAS